MSIEVHTSRLKDYVMPNFPPESRVHVIDYYERIRSFLNGKKELGDQQFIAEPRVGKMEIKWMSQVFSTRPCKISELEDREKKRYFSILYSHLSGIENIIFDLEQGNDNDRLLAKLLTKVISYIDEESVYCGENSVVLVNWGVNRRIQNAASGIYKSGLYLNNWKEKLDKNVDVPEPNKDGEEDALEQNEVITDIPPLESSDKEEQSEEQIESLSKPELQDVEPEPHEKEKVQIRIEDTPERKEKQESTSHVWWRKFKAFITSRGCLKYLLWLFLLLLLCLLLLKLCAPSYLPSDRENFIPPVDTAHIGFNRDSTIQIINNKLGVILNKQEGKTIEEFARTFKEIYPSEEYKIVYYNDKTYTLLLEVPESERQHIKDILVTQMPDFDFYLFDEATYGSNVSFNDPGLLSSDYRWPFVAIKAFDAWEITLGDPEIVVAVVDNGFDIRHPEIASHVIKPYNSYTRTADVSPAKGDGHGTHVSATAVGSCNNGKGVLGIAPNCKLIPVRVSDSNGRMSTMAIMEGVLYAIYEGADVINISLGMEINPEVQRMPIGMQMNMAQNSSLEEEQAWNHIGQIAESRNCILVFAAGNSNVVSGIDPSKRNPQTIRVSAVDQRLRKADFSNFGNFGENIPCYSTVSAPGVGIYSAVPNNEYDVYNGTSMAAPIVTGAVALMKSVNKGLNTNQIINILKETGIHVNEPVGNIIQLSKAVAVAAGRAPLPGGVVDCDSIARRARALQEELQQLKKMCPELALVSDTLKFDDAVNDPSSMNGVWKSTTTLYNSTTNAPIELYFQFSDMKGELKIVETARNETFIAPLSVSKVGGNLQITQHTPAVNGQGESYVIYRYTCRADKAGNLECTAIRVDNGQRIIFNLVKIR